jgi:flagellin
MEATFNDITQGGMSMAMSVNTNVSSLTAQRNLLKSGSGLNTSLQRLSSGLRINSAKDDAAGLAITDRMTSQVRGLDQAVRNANDGISLAQTAEGALEETTSLVQRIRELSIQAANDTNSTSDRRSLQDEVVELQAEINRIADTTAFNGKTLLDGTTGYSTFHVGAESDQVIVVSTGDARADSLGSWNSTIRSEIAVAADAATAADAAKYDGANLTINGADGIEEAEIISDLSAREAAVQINYLKGQTGVTARAETEFTITGFATATGGAQAMYSFELTSGEDNLQTANVTAAVTNGDLSTLVTAINDHTAATGVRATLDDSGTVLTMINEEGDNIGINLATDGTNGETWVVHSATDNNDTTYDETNHILTDDVALTSSSLNVRGDVKLQSSSAFNVGGAAGELGAEMYFHEDMAAGNDGRASKLASVADIDITTQEGANEAITIADKAIEKIDSIRSNLGAIQNRFTSTISNLTNVSENISASKSRILDADFASETAALTKSQILQQAGIAMLSQANQMPQNALSLLQ